MTRLIDADALERAIKTECNPYGKPTIDFESGKKVLKIINNAPTVNPYFPYKITDTEFEHGDNFYIITPSGKKVEFEKKRPHGEWKVKATSTFIQYQPNEYVCPFCNTIVNYKTDFCSHCGADMRGDKE